MKVLKWIDEKLEETILIALLAIITIVMGIQVLARMFGSPLTWSEEVSRYCFVWSGFLSIGYCFRQGISIKIDMFIDMLPKVAKNIFTAVQNILMLVFYVYMWQFTYAYFMNSVASGQLSPATQIPMWIIQLAPVVGFTGAIIRLVQCVIKSFMALGGKDAKAGA